MNIQKIVVPRGSCNTSNDEIRQQVDYNIRRGLPQLKAHASCSDRIALVCGGPSLKTTEHELRELVWDGAKIVAVNGSYQWCIDRGLKPSAFVMLDAREFNARFVETPVPNCKYLLASQCHPRTFEICRERNVTIWHTVSSGPPELDLLDNYYWGRIHPIHSFGTTVAIRAIGVMRVLGYSSFDMFGFDSCWFDDDHHAYRQPENDDDQYVETWIRPSQDKVNNIEPQRFFCAAWHWKQAEDFQNFLRSKQSGQLRLNVHGDGLIAGIMNMAVKARSMPTIIKQAEEVQEGRQLELVS